MKKLGLADWAHVAEIFGGVAIIASLIFVGIELRQTTEQLILTSDIDADLANITLSVNIAANDELSDLVYRGERDPQSLTDQEMARFENIAVPRLAIWENTYQLYLFGNLTEADWKGWDAYYRLRWNFPGYAVVYRKFRGGFGNKSVGYFEDVFGLEPVSRD